MIKPAQVVILVLAVGLLAAGVLSGMWTDHAAYEQKAASSIFQSLESIMARADREAGFLLNSADTATAWASVHDSFFLFDSLQVKAWTRNDFLPDARVLQDTFTVRLLQVAQGDYLLKKWNVKKFEFLIFVLPLQVDHAIVNNYLTSEWNKALFHVPLKIVEAGGEGAPVTSATGHTYFRIQTREVESGEGPSNVTALLLVTSAILCILIVLIGLVRSWHRRRRYELAFLGLAGSLLSLRIVMVKLGFPQIFSDVALFDPHRFASSSFNASMGDLLLNSLVVLSLCIYLFLTYPHWKVFRIMTRNKTAVKFGLSCLCLFLCFLALVYPYLFIEIIYHNSSISLEITDSLSFDDIRTVAFISVILGCVSSFLFTHVFFRLAMLLVRNHRGRFWLTLAVSAVLFLLFFYLDGKAYWITLEVGLVYFAILYAGDIVQQFRGFTFKTFLYFMVVTLGLATQGALALRRFDDERRIGDQFRFGGKFLVDQDVLGEFLLNESAVRIKRDHFIQSIFTSPFLSKSSIRQKVRTHYLNTYFNRYDIQIFLYNSSGEPYEVEETTDFADLIKTYQGENYKTAYPGIYFINTPTTETTKQYLVIVPVERHRVKAGYVVLDLKLKRVIPRNVYPELLVDNRFHDYFKSKEFSYAVYTRGLLTNNFGDFNYEKDFPAELLNQPRLFQTGISHGAWYHAALEDQNGQVAVVTAKTYPPFYLVTNFAFLFVLGLMMILVVLAVTGGVTWAQGGRLDYAARIQFYVYLSFFLPLLTVSITTLSLINRSAEVQLRTEYEDRARTLGEKLSLPLEEFLRDPDHYRGEGRITELAKLADLDASVYGIDGELIASSQPLIYENQLKSSLVNRHAWHAIVHDKATSFIADERIGKLHYNCTYVSIQSSESGKELGILSIPFFGSAQSLEKVRINVLANILSVFVLVFILFSVLSFFVSRGLTFPLRFIAKSIKKTTLTGKNEVIRWDSNDEVGLLASEYNRMIGNLEQSRKELARVQKETAWREIAKQVAHEIKNPLTPMKLTLQQMEQALGRDELSPDKSKKAISTLLAQVEILNEIATSFSTFARMPAPELERIDLTALLKTVTDLHQNYPEGTVSLLNKQSPLFVLGNQQLLTRVFGNIVLNALQSGRDNGKVAVSISVRQENGKYQVRFEDNGRGIDREIQDKVFLPHFSTKKTGSGLGLAIAKQGIEQTGGAIWFETSSKGTTFYVELVRAENGR